jgi:hypothetical protein
MLNIAHKIDGIAFLTGYMELSNLREVLMGKKLHELKL